MNCVEACDSFCHPVRAGGAAVVSPATLYAAAAVPPPVPRLRSVAAQPPAGLLSSATATNLHRSWSCGGFLLCCGQVTPRESRLQPGILARDPLRRRASVVSFRAAEHRTGILEASTVYLPLKQLVPASRLAYGFQTYAPEARAAKQNAALHAAGRSRPVKLGCRHRSASEPEPRDGLFSISSASSRARALPACPRAQLHVAPVFPFPQRSYSFLPPDARGRLFPNILLVAAPGTQTLPGLKR